MDINAPGIFAATWKLLIPLLDKRVKEKVKFVNNNNNNNNNNNCEKSLMVELSSLKERLGNDAIDWILAEVRDNKIKRKTPKQYWIPPSPSTTTTSTSHSDNEDAQQQQQQQQQHDPRGMKSYINSEFYVQTPGDVWQQRQQQQQQEQHKIIIFHEVL
jgi:hypothetical protein